MVTESTLILNAEQIAHKVRRMAYEILEKNYGYQSIVLAGIKGQGYALASLLHEELVAMGGIKSTLACITLTKHAQTQPEVHLDLALHNSHQEVVVVVDDVLLSGKTLLHALQPFVQWELKKLQVAVLVDRNYATYPIKANYVGYALSTTIDEHVEVELMAETKAVYLR